MIKTVIRTIRDNVMVLDEDGEQLPEYQGRYEEAREKILRDVTEETNFFREIEEAGINPVSKENW